MDNRYRNTEGRTGRRDPGRSRYAVPDDRGFSEEGRGYVRAYDSRYSADYDEAYGRNVFDADRGRGREGYYSQGPARSHLRCRDIMTRNVVSCHRDTPIMEVARLMRDEDIGAVPVIGANGRLEGIVTDRDLVVEGLTSDKEDVTLRAEDCMSTDLYTANQNDRVVDMIREMGDHQVRRVPIVDSRDRLVGIVSMADVALQTNKDRELGDSLEEISKPHSFLDRVAKWFGF